MIPVGHALLDEYGEGLFTEDETSQIKKAKKIALPLIMELIKDDLPALGVRHDKFVSEQSLHDSGAVDAIVEKLDKMGLIYEGF